MLSLIGPATLNIVYSSLIGFFCSVLLIKGTIFILKLPPGRTRFFLYLLPVIKIPIDQILCSWTNWCYLQNLNPITAIPGTRTLNAKVNFIHYLLPKIDVNLKLVHGSSFSLGDCLYPFFASNTVSIFSLTIIAVATIKLLKSFLKWKAEKIQIIKYTTHSHTISLCELEKHIQKLY